MIFHLFPRITEAANYKNCLLSATSYLISLEVSPTPKLSQNLSGSPLITVHLRHHLASFLFFDFLLQQGLFDHLYNCRKNLGWIGAGQN